MDRTFHTGNGVRPSGFETGASLRFAHRSILSKLCAPLSRGRFTPGARLQDRQWTQGDQLRLPQDFRALGKVSVSTGNQPGLGSDPGGPRRLVPSPNRIILLKILRPAPHFQTRSLAQPPGALLRFVEFACPTIP